MISIAKFIAKDNELLLAKLKGDITLITSIDAKENRAMRLDTLTILALYEFILLIKFGIYIPDKGLENLFCSDSTIFI